MEMEVIVSDPEKAIEIVQSTFDSTVSSITVEPADPPTISPVDSNVQQESLDVTLKSLVIEENNDVKPCSVELERCDKIWETLQLIRDLQEDVNSNDSNHGERENTSDEEDDPASSINDNESYSSTQANPIAPYIQYEPVLNNGNTALPNFQFSVKSTRLLHQCFTCGKQYSHRSTLRDHSEKVHNIIIPRMRNRSDNNTPENRLETKTEIKEEIDRDDNNASPASIVDNDGRLLDDASETHSDKEVTQRSDKLFPCQYCTKGYNRRGHLYRHMKFKHEKQEHPRNNLNVHRCKSCGKHFYDKSSLRTHCRKLHGIYVRQPRASAKNKHDGQRTITQYVVKKSQNVDKKIKQQHTAKTRNSKIRKISGTATPCLICKINYPDRNSWVEHCEKAHTIERGFQMEPSDDKLKCKKCLRRYRSLQSLISHMCTVHGLPLLLQCRTCGARFKDADSCMLHTAEEHSIIIIPHIRNHVVGKAEYKCHKCSSFYSRSEVLRVHQWHFHGIPFQPMNSALRKNVSTSKSPPAAPVIKDELVDSTEKINRRRRKSYDDAKEISKTFRHLKTPIAALRTATPRSLRETVRVNYDENSQFQEINSRRSLPVMPIIKTEVLQESNSSPGKTKFTETATTMDIICLLCGKRCKLIKRHLIHYHKIRRPEALIAQCRQVLPIDHSQPKQVQKTLVKKEPVPIKSPRSKIVDKKNLYPGIRLLGSRIPKNIEEYGLWVFQIAGNNRRVYACKLCDNVRTMSWRHMQIHEFEQHTEHYNTRLLDDQRVTSTSDSPINSQAPPAPSNKRKRESIDNRDTRRRRLSDSVTSSADGTRATRASTKLKEASEHRCGVCYRLFRNAEILSSHKISCTIPPDTSNNKNSSNLQHDNAPTIEGSDTRESSDRDSGIGISITIKKRNNSYEIVSRDVNDDTKESDNTALFTKDENSSSDISLNTFSKQINNTNENETSEINKSFQYSKNHEVIKIQKHIEDEEDVDIDSETVDSIPFIAPSETNSSPPPLSETMEQDPIFVETPRFTENTPALEVLSLVKLCENVISQAQTNSWRCRVCIKSWPSLQSFAAHMKIHKDRT